MKKADTLTTLFRHNTWANISLLEFCRSLTEEQLKTTLNGTYGSIYDTFIHIVLAENGYLARVSHTQRYRHPADAPPLTLPEMAIMAQETGEGLVQWAARVRPDDAVAMDWDGTLRDVPKTVILTQVINHATEHRAQIMTILTQLGIEPPELSAWTYFDALS